MTATKKQLWLHLARATVLLVVLLGGWMWALHPGQALKWAVAMFMLPVAWGCGALLRHVGVWRTMTDTDELRLLRAMAGAGSIVAVALGLRLADAFALFGGGVSERAMGVILGLVLVIVGNFMPKNVEPSSEERCEPSAAQALQRFAGWTFVLAGVAYSLVWLVFPLRHASLVSTLTLAAAVLLVAARLLRAVLPRKSVRPPAEL